MGRASANPTQVLWYNKSGIFNRLVPCSDNISQLSCSSYTKLLNSYDCAYYVPIVSGCLSWDSLANLSLWLLLNLINLTPRCSSVSDEKLSLCLERFLWSLVCLCSCVSAALLSWSLLRYHLIAWAWASGMANSISESWRGVAEEAIRVLLVEGGRVQNRPGMIMRV